MSNPLTDLLNEMMRDQGDDQHPAPSITPADAVKALQALDAAFLKNTAVFSPGDMLLPVEEAAFYNQDNDVPVLFGGYLSETIQGYGRKNVGLGSCEAALVADCVVYEVAMTSGRDPHPAVRPWPMDSRALRHMTDAEKEKLGLS